MARTKGTTSAEMRRCIGSVKFGIVAHEAPVEDFPAQPSQKDGLGRMCRPHWKEYTSALRRASTPPQAAPAAVAEVERARTDKAEAKATNPAKAKSVTKSGAGKPSRKSAAAEDDATVAAEAATTPDTEAAEQDAILVERRQRVKAWRKSELEGTAAKA